MTTYKILYDKKDEYVNLFRDFLPRTVEGFESMVLSITDIEKLKKNEQNLQEKEYNKYFCYKLTNPVLFTQITEAVAPYLPDDKLIMLGHPWSTQINGALNNLVQSYAPKTRNFSKTMCMRTRVGITTGILALGYEYFCT